MGKHSQTSNHLREEFGSYAETGGSPVSFELYEDLFPLPTAESDLF